MKHLYLFLILSLAACSPALTSPETTASPEALSLQIIAPDNESEFVESNLWLEWDGPALAENQFFVLRLWYGEEAPQEVWTQEKRLNAKDLIDSYSRDLGTYHWQIAIVNTNAEGGFDSIAHEWTAVQNLHRVRRLSIQPLPINQMSQTARFIAEQGFTTATETIDFARSWMYQNTNIGSELLIYSADYSDAAQLMYNHYTGEGEAPQMYCNGISTTLLTVLLELGIESRLIFLYGEVPGWISEHTVLEVFNPDTQAWEIHDGTRDMVFIDIETGHRVPISRMVFGSFDTIQGCNSEGCSADNVTYIKEPLGAFRYGYSTEVWVNPDRLNISQRIHAFDNENFADFIAREAGVPVVQMTFHFDSWDIPPLEETE